MIDRLKAVERALRALAPSDRRGPLMHIRFHGHGAGSAAGGRRLPRRRDSTPPGGFGRASRSCAATPTTWPTSPTRWSSAAATPPP